MSALRAFEAAARLLSFTAAAAELGVTQSAVSHAIREIEARLSTSLFRREGTRVELTEAGRRYEPFAREALARLREGARAVGALTGRNNILTVSVSPSFAAKWLAPRLGAYADAHPDLELRISAAAHHIDFSDSDIDLAIRHGAGRWQGLAATRLCSEVWIAVCAPALAKGSFSARRIASMPLIHHRDERPWRDWFAKAGVAAPGRRAGSVTYNEMNLVIDAAIEGQGVALARSALAARDLAAGRLIVLNRFAPEAAIGYWIVYPKARAETPNIRRFTAWLQRQAAADAAAITRLIDQREGSA